MITTIDFKESQQIARTILEQLGGGQFVALTGARNFCSARVWRGVQFSIGSGAKDGINKVRVILEPSDVYTVAFYSVHGARFDCVSIHTDIYCDVLQDLFESTTGFYCTLAAR